MSGSRDSGRASIDPDSERGRMDGVTRKTSITERSGETKSSSGARPSSGVRLSSGVRPSNLIEPSNRIGASRRIEQTGRIGASGGTQSLAEREPFGETRPSTGSEPAKDWASYWRAADGGLESMRAHFERHRYHRHSHDAYSFGVTECGAQAFRCRGENRTSAAGMVMAFNPDDPHDGHAASEPGFTYRIIHVEPTLVADILRDSGAGGGLPLFAQPVRPDEALGWALVRLDATLRVESSQLAKDEVLTTAVTAMVQRASTRSVPDPRDVDISPATSRLVATRAYDVLSSDVARDVSAEALAATVGCSRFALNRAVRSTYGMAPSDLQRQLRLRESRRLVIAGYPLAEIATRCGFADQSHLTRWFSRCYGITPGAYRAAAAS